MGIRSEPVLSPCPAHLFKMNPLSSILLLSVVVAAMGAPEPFFFGKIKSKIDELKAKKYAKFGGHGGGHGSPYGHGGYVYMVPTGVGYGAGHNSGHYGGHYGGNAGFMGGLQVVTGSGIYGHGGHGSAGKVVYVPVSTGTYGGKGSGSAGQVVTTGSAPVVTSGSAPVVTTGSGSTSYGGRGFSRALGGQGGSGFYFGLQKGFGGFGNQAVSYRPQKVVLTQQPQQVVITRKPVSVAQKPKNYRTVVITHEAQPQESIDQSFLRLNTDQVHSQDVVSHDVNQPGVVSYTTTQEAGQPKRVVSITTTTHGDDQPLQEVVKSNSKMDMSNW